jgi:hypothetical protein
MWERRYFRIAKQATHKTNMRKKCGRYIKFANKNETNLMQEILQRNPFNENIK